MSVVTDLLSGSLTGLLSGAGDFATKIRTAITGKSVLTADQLAEIEKVTIQHQAELAQQEAALKQRLVEADQKVIEGQIELDKIEASSTSSFKSMWRPSVGWVCVVGLFYSFLLQPLLPWAARLGGKPIPDMPPLDTSVLMTLLLGMLGLGGMRTYEKKAGLTK